MLCAVCLAPTDQICRVQFLFCPASFAVNRRSSPYFYFFNVSRDYEYRIEEALMDLAVLKKKLSTFRSETGKLMNVSDELLYEILVAWEAWTGPASRFYSSIGADHRKMAKLIGRAKRLKREGVFPSEEFKEVKISDNIPGAIQGPCQGMEVLWDNGKLIRFAQVETLIDFLKKAS